MVIANKPQGVPVGFVLFVKMSLKMGLKGTFKKKSLTQIRERKEMH